MSSEYKYVEREAQRLAFHILHLKSYNELIAKGEYNIKVDKDILYCQYKNKSITIELPKNFKKMSIDDLSERIIQPAIYALCDWKRAFNIDIYI